MRTCAPLFRISEAAGRIALKFGMRLVIHKINVLQKVPLVMSFTEVNVQLTCRCAHAQPPPFHISGTAGQIALKIGVQLGNH